MALVDAGRLRRRLAHPPAAAVRAGARGDGRRAGRTAGADHPAAEHSRGPDVQHRPQEPDGLPRPRRLPRRPLPAVGERVVSAGVRAAARVREARGASRPAGVPVLVWAEDEPSEDVLDLDVSPALVDAMSRPRPEPEGSGFVRPGAAEYSAVEDAAGGGPSEARARVEALPAFLGAGNPAVALRPDDVETLPGDSREIATVSAAVEALHEAVEGAAAGCRKDAAAAAWHAEAVVRFFCATFGGGVASVQVTEDGFIVAGAEVAGDGLVDVSITVGPEGTCACRGSAGGAHMAFTAADARSFETVLTEGLAQVGVHAPGGDSRR